MQYADGTSPITYTVTGSITGRRVTMSPYSVKPLSGELSVTPDPLSSTNIRTGKITSTSSAKSKMGVYYGERELARSTNEIAFGKVDLIVPQGPGTNGGTPLPEDRLTNGGAAPATNELNPGTFVLLLPQDQTNRVATTLTLKADPTGGSVTLDQHGLTDLKIYTDEALQDELTMPKTWTNGETPPSTLYMVGSSSSTNLQSAQGPLDLTYKANLAASGAEYSIKDTVGVNLLPVQIEVRKKGDAVPPNGVLVKTGDVLEFVLAPQFFDTEDNFESLITWQYRQRKSDGTYEDWADFGTHGTGTKFEHTTGTGGIFQVKAVITNGGEHEYKRKKNEKMGNFEYGPGKKDQPDSIGVCDTQIQIAICREAQSFYGSEVYAGWNVLPAQHGFPEYPASGNSVIRCNIFVAHRATVAGAVVPKINGFFNEYPPLANEWAGIEDTSIWPGDPTHIAGWPILSSATYPQPGWIIAHPQPGDAGHCAITDYDGEGIGAGTSGTVNKKYLEFWDGTSRLRMYQPAP